MERAEHTESALHTADIDSPERFVPELMMGRLVAAEHLARYAFASELVTDRVVLDAGCGVGYGSKMLREAGARYVLGVDRDVEAVADALQRAGRDSHFVVGDLCQIAASDSSFDVVICLEVIEHLNCPEQALHELKRVLRKDGLLVVSSPNRNASPRDNHHHVFEYTPQELNEMLSMCFSKVALWRQQAFFASFISDVCSTTTEHDPRLDARVQRANRGDADEQMYMVALASDEALPTPVRMVGLGDVAEIRWWHEHLRGLQQQVDELGATITGLESEKWLLGERLLNAERDNAQLLSSKSSVRQLSITLEDIRRELIALEGSRSWRVTAPLRGVLRLLRRLRNGLGGLSAR